MLVPHVLCESRYNILSRGLAHPGHSLFGPSTKRLATSSCVDLCSPCTHPATLANVASQARGSPRTGHDGAPVTHPYYHYFLCYCLHSTPRGMVLPLHWRGTWSPTPRATNAILSQETPDPMRRFLEETWADESHSTKGSFCESLI